MEQGVTTDTVYTVSEEEEAFSKKNDSKVRIGMADYVQSLKRMDLLLYLAFSDLRRRYRRTVIGPFWTSLSLAIYVSSMGVLFSLLWHMEIKTFLPYFASGFVVWTFFSTNLNESCTTFTAVEGYMKQISLPYSFYASLVTLRNLIIFSHQIIIYLIIAIIFKIEVTRYTLLAIPGMILLLLNCHWMAIALGMFCARFRDVQQVVMSMLQIFTFITPLFWAEKQLGNGIAAFLCINLNPLYHFISVVRYPLLGKPANIISWEADLIILLCGWTLSMFCLSRNYRKIVYWL